MAPNEDHEETRIHGHVDDLDDHLAYDWDGYDSTTKQDKATSRPQTGAETREFAANGKSQAKYAAGDANCRCGHDLLLEEETLLKGTKQPNIEETTAGSSDSTAYRIPVNNWEEPESKTTTQSPVKDNSHESTKRANEVLVDDYALKSDDDEDGFKSINRDNSAVYPVWVSSTSTTSQGSAHNKRHRLRRPHSKSVKTRGEEVVETVTSKGENKTQYKENQDDREERQKKQGKVSGTGKAITNDETTFGSNGNTNSFHVHNWGLMSKTTTIKLTTTVGSNENIVHGIPALTWEPKTRTTTDGISTIGSNENIGYGIPVRNWEQTTATQRHVKDNSQESTKYRTIEVLVDDYDLKSNDDGFKSINRDNNAVYPVLISSISTTSPGLAHNKRHRLQGPHSKRIELWGQKDEETVKSTENDEKTRKVLKKTTTTPNTVGFEESDDYDVYARNWRLKSHTTKSLVQDDSQKSTESRKIKLIEDDYDVKSRLKAGEYKYGMKTNRKGDNFDYPGWGQLTSKNQGADHKRLRSRRPHSKKIDLRGQKDVETGEKKKKEPEKTITINETTFDSNDNILVRTWGPKKMTTTDRISTTVFSNENIIIPVRNWEEKSESTIDSPVKDNNNKESKGKITIVLFEDDYDLKSEDEDVINRDNKAVYPGSESLTSTETQGTVYEKRRGSNRLHPKRLELQMQKAVETVTTKGENKPQKMETQNDRRRMTANINKTNVGSNDRKYHGIYGPQWESKSETTTNGTATTVGLKEPIRVRTWEPKTTTTDGITTTVSSNDNIGYIIPVRNWEEHESQTKTQSQDKDNSQKSTGRRTIELFEHDYGLKFNDEQDRTKSSSMSNIGVYLGWAQRTKEIVHNNRHGSRRPHSKRVKLRGQENGKSTTSKDENDTEDKAAQEGEKGKEQGKITEKITTKPKNRDTTVGLKENSDYDIPVLNWEPKSKTTQRPGNIVKHSHETTKIKTIEVLMDDYDHKSNDDEDRFKSINRHNSAVYPVWVSSTSTTLPGHNKRDRLRGPHSNPIERVKSTQDDGEGKGKIWEETTTKPSSQDTTVDVKESKHYDIAGRNLGLKSEATTNGITATVASNDNIVYGIPDYNWESGIISHRRGDTFDYPGWGQLTTVNQEADHSERHESYRPHSESWHQEDVERVTMRSENNSKGKETEDDREKGKESETTVGTKNHGIHVRKWQSKLTTGGMATTVVSNLGDSIPVRNWEPTTATQRPVKNINRDSMKVRAIEVLVDDYDLMSNDDDDGFKPTNRDKNAVYPVWVSSTSTTSPGIAYDKRHRSRRPHSKVELRSLEGVETLRMVNDNPTKEYQHDRGKEGKEHWKLSETVTKANIEGTTIGSNENIGYSIPVRNWEPTTQRPIKDNSQESKKIRTIEVLVDNYDLKSNDEDGFKSINRDSSAVYPLWVSSTSTTLPGLAHNKRYRLRGENKPQRKGNQYVRKEEEKESEKTTTTPKRQDLTVGFEESGEFDVSDRNWGLKSHTTTKSLVQDNSRKLTESRNIELIEDDYDLKSGLNANDYEYGIKPPQRGDNLDYQRWGQLISTNQRTGDKRRRSRRPHSKRIGFRGQENVETGKNKLLEKKRDDKETGKEPEKTITKTAIDKTTVDSTDNIVVSTWGPKKMTTTVSNENIGIPVHNWEEMFESKIDSPVKDNIQESKGRSSLHKNDYDLKSNNDEDAFKSINRDNNAVNPVWVSSTSTSAPGLAHNKRDRLRRPNWKGLELRGQDVAGRVTSRGDNKTQRKENQSNREEKGKESEITITKAIIDETTIGSNDNTNHGIKVNWEPKSMTTTNKITTTVGSNDEIVYGIPYYTWYSSIKSHRKGDNFDYPGWDPLTSTIEKADRNQKHGSLGPHSKDRDQEGVKTVTLSIESKAQGKKTQDNSEVTGKKSGRTITTANIDETTVDSNENSNHNIHARNREPKSNTITQRPTEDNIQESTGRRTIELFEGDYELKSDEVEDGIQSISKSKHGVTPGSAPRSTKGTVYNKRHRSQRPHSKRVELRGQEVKSIQSRIENKTEDKATQERKKREEQRNVTEKTTKKPKYRNTTVGLKESNDYDIPVSSLRLKSQTMSKGPVNNNSKESTESKTIEVLEDDYDLKSELKSSDYEYETKANRRGDNINYPGWGPMTQTTTEEPDHYLRHGSRGPPPMTVELRGQETRETVTSKKDVENKPLDQKNKRQGEEKEKSYKKGSNRKGRRRLGGRRVDVYSQRKPTEKIDDEGTFDLLNSGVEYG